MKNESRHYFTDDFTDKALNRLETVQSDETLSRGEKLIALMSEAQKMCDRQTPPPQPKTRDLFSDIPKADPYAICVTYFTEQLESAKADTSNKPFNPTVTVGEPFNGGTSVYAHASKIAKESGKKYPELKEFVKLIKQNFAPEIQENKIFDNRAKEKYTFQKAQAKHYKTGKLHTEAHTRYSLNYDPTYRYVLLMHNAADALYKMPHTDLKHPYDNPELLVSLWHTGKNKDGGLLYHIKSSPVLPEKSVRRPGGSDMVTPMQYAQDIAQTKGLEELGQLFTTRLTDHQDALKLYAEKPHIFEKGYQKRHRPS